MSVILDADEIRHNLNSDLGYSIADREENPVYGLIALSKLEYRKADTHLCRNSREWC